MKKKLKLLMINYKKGEHDRTVLVEDKEHF